MDQKFNNLPLSNFADSLRTTTIEFSKSYVFKQSCCHHINVLLKNSFMFQSVSTKFCKRKK